MTSGKSGLLGKMLTTTEKEDGEIKLGRHQVSKILKVGKHYHGGHRFDGGCSEE
ncbi:hypothetical protein BVC80_1787g75 [Macleaya cordata]|uniref:Uncharacterized protein n=1 Tax=Macleaya cordata TaxID=56857 RepID=A0A200QU78_MACCD|nr:hypothetical protein BVC80_1787g75 [Macleaya cordata]